MTAPPSTPRRWATATGCSSLTSAHHLPGEFYRVIAEYSIAPYRLGLTATVERSDGRESDLDALVGPVVYYKTAADLSGDALAEHRIVQIKVKLSETERARYDELIKTRNNFLAEQNINLGNLVGWGMFVRASARSTAGPRGHARAPRGSSHRFWHRGQAAGLVRLARASTTRRARSSLPTITRPFTASRSLF